jgi:hypothetical protein
MKERRMASIGRNTSQPKVTVYVVRWYDASNTQVSRTFSHLEDARRFVRDSEAAIERGGMAAANDGRTVHRDVAADWFTAPTGLERRPQLRLVKDLAATSDGLGEP